MPGTQLVSQQCFNKVITIIIIITLKLLYQHKDSSGGNKIFLCKD